VLLRCCRPAPRSAPYHHAAVLASAFPDLNVWFYLCWDYYLNSNWSDLRRSRSSRGVTEGVIKPSGSTPAHQPFVSASFVLTLPCLIMHCPSPLGGQIIPACVLLVSSGTCTLVLSPDVLMRYLFLHLITCHPCWQIQISFHHYLALSFFHDSPGHWHPVSLSPGHVEQQMPRYTCQSQQTQWQLSLKCLTKESKNEGRLQVKQKY